MENESSGDRSDFSNFKQQEYMGYTCGKATFRERRLHKKEYREHHKHNHEAVGIMRANKNRILPEKQNNRTDSPNLEIEMSTFSPGNLSDSISIARSNPHSSVTGSERVSRRSRSTLNHSASTKRSGTDVVMAESTPARHAGKVALCVLVSVLVGCGVGAGIGYGVFSLISDSSSSAPSVGNGNGQEGGSSITQSSTNSVVQANSQSNPSSKTSGSSSSTSTREIVIEGKQTRSCLKRGAIDLFVEILKA